MRKITAIIAAALALTAFSAEAGERWTLAECIQYALDHNITIQQSAINVEQRKVEVSTAEGNRLPAVSAGSSQNFSFGRGLTADNTYANTNTTSTSFSLGADLPLFNGNRISNNIAMSRLNLQAAVEDLEKAKDDIRVAVARAYMQVLYDNEILSVASRQVEIDSVQVARLEEMMRVGKASSAEVASQKATLAQSRVAEVQSRSNLSLALLDLAQLLELPSPEGFDVAVPEAEADNIALLATPEAIYMEAVGIKPAVRGEEIRLGYAEKNIALARGGYLPSLSLSGGLGTNYYTNSMSQSAKFFEQLGTNFSQYVGLSLNIPVFSRLANRNNVKSARLAYSQQQLQLDNVKKQLYKEIQQAYYNAVAAGSKFGGSQEAERSAAEAFRLMKAKYENGKATVTEFNESKNQYLKASSDLAQARYEYIFLTKLLDFYRGKELTL